MFRVDGKVELHKTETFIEFDIIKDGVQVGTVELCPERKEISRLNIWTPYQNYGYGTQVVKELVEHGYSSLWVRSDNPRAIHVYEKCGFKKSGETMFEMKLEEGEAPTIETETKKCPICGSDLYEQCGMCCYEGEKVRKSELWSV